MKYLHGHKQRVERKEITGSTLRNLIKPIKLFCEQLDFDISWKKIIRGMPRGRRYANDRAPTLDELRKLTQYPDRRIKPIIYTMVSSGIRIGAFDYLKWGDITPMTRQNKIVAAKIVIYAGEEEEYFSFTTKEAYDSLHEWMDYRKQCGESIIKDTRTILFSWKKEESRTLTITK